MRQNRTIQNAKWIIGCKIIQSLLQMVVGMLSARYLGPSNYGLINYAASIVAFAVPVMQLGMHSTLVQEYVLTPEREGQIMGTSLALNLVSGGACIIGVTSFAAVTGTGDATTVVVCAIYSIQLIFQALEMFQCWFQAKLLSKYSSLAMLGAYIVVSAYKIWLLATRKSVYWFALSHSVEYCFVGVAMIVAYKKLGGQHLAFSWTLARDMFSRSKYYILADLMVKAFNSTSPVLLKLMVDAAETGFYTAAVTCSCVTQFVFLAIVDTYRPVILESKKESQAAFEKNVSRLYSIILYMAFGQTIGFVLLAHPIVRILYGKEYMAAAPVLQILICQTAFSYMGTVRNIWILGEGKHNILWVINLWGAIASVTFNIVLIPLWGACGAAFASVLTQIFTNFILGFLMPLIRQNNRLLLRGLNPKLLWDLLKKLKA